MIGISLEGDRYYETWICFVRESLSCMDLKTHNWVHLPNSGGYYDQDEFIMIIWEYIRHEYIIASQDEEFLKSVAVQNKAK